MRNALFTALLMFCALMGFVAGRDTFEPPPVAHAQPEVVRVLDVVVRDSNTTNHRQRFECRPAKEKR